jgi:KaiC/GvpD/RAD55 family RecA-like ATPase
MARISTGLEELDNLIEGGFPEGAVILLSGGPGTGKSLFGLNFISSGANANEKSCYFSYNEDKKALIKAANNVGFLYDTDKYPKDSLIIQKLSIRDEMGINKFIDLLGPIPDIDLIVIDSLNKLLIYTENSKEYRREFSNLVENLRLMSKCSLLICETETGMDTGNGEAFECDGVIGMSFLDFEEKPMRTLQIHKMRYTAIEPKVAHELEIDNRGVRLSTRSVI